LGSKKKEKRKNLTTQWSNLYVVITIFFVAGFAFFLTSKLIIADEIDVLYTEIGEEYNLNSSGEYTIKEWIYDEKNNQMQVTLITSGMTDYLSELNFNAISRVDLTRELPTEIAYSSNDIYIVKIKEVPKTFKQVALRLVKDEIKLDEIFDEESQLDDKEEKEENLITSIYTDERVVEHGEILNGNVNDFALKVTDEMMTEAYQEIAELQKEIQKNKLVIQKINEEINQLKNEIIYQTVDEQTETNNRIYSLEREIERYSKAIEEIELDIDSRNEKIKRLTQRKRDLQM
jgi:hypothetical protein